MKSSDNKIQKVSVRFFNDREVRAVWDEMLFKWWYSVLDVVGVLNDQDDYTKNRNYWKYLKTKLKKEENEVVSTTNQLKLLAPDGKRRLTDVLDTDGILQLAACFPNTKASRFVAWFTNSEESIDGKSKSKAYTLFESSIESIEVGNGKGSLANSRLSVWWSVRLRWQYPHGEYCQGRLSVCHGSLPAFYAPADRADA